MWVWCVLDAVQELVDQVGLQDVGHVDSLRELGGQERLAHAPGARDDDDQRNSLVMEPARQRLQCYSPQARPCSTRARELTGGQRGGGT